MLNQALRNGITRDYKYSPNLPPSPHPQFDFNKELYTFLIFVGSEGGKNGDSQVISDQSPHCKTFSHPGWQIERQQDLPPTGGISTNGFPGWRFFSFKLYKVCDGLFMLYIIVCCLMFCVPSLPPDYIPTMQTSIKIHVIPALLNADTDTCGTES